MLAEIAAANVAFKLIKAALSNGKELYNCSAAAQSYFSDYVYGSYFGERKLMYNLSN